MAFTTWLAALSWTDLWTAVLLPLGWVVAFLIFLVRARLRGVPATERIARAGATPWLPRLVMEFGYWVFSLPVGWCARLRITPDMLTWGSLGLTGFAAVRLGQGRFGVGGWALLLACMFDAWDGILARRLARASAAGEFFDSTIDRYNDLLTLLGLMYYYRAHPPVLVLCAAALIGTTLVSYTRAKGEALGVDPNVGHMQRHERAVYLGGAAVFSPLLAVWLEPEAIEPVYHLMVVGLGVVAVVTNLTAVQRARFVLRGLRPPTTA